MTMPWSPKLQTQIALLMSRKGQIVTVTTERFCKVRKGVDPIIKRSTFQCRVGVNYDNIAAVQAGRANGTLPEKNAGLPYGEWAIFPFLIEVKGDYHIRCTAIKNNFKRSSEYFQYNQAITKQEAEVKCLASEFGKGTAPEVFNIKMSSLIDIH